MHKTTREQQAKETKDNLLSCSLNLIKQHGYDNVKISEICNACGVTIGAFYHHFTNKEGIIIAGYSQCDEFFKRVVMNELKEIHPIHKIIEYLIFQAKYAEDLGVDLITQVYKAQLIHGTDFFLSNERTLPANLEILISKAQTDKKLTQDIKASVIRDELLLISRGCIYNWCQNDGNYDLKNKVKQVIEHQLLYFQTDERSN